jgi:hypothetical protein
MGPRSHDEKYHLHGLQLVSWNLFVLAGLVMLAFASAAAARAWLRRPAAGRAEPRPRPAP